jgi:hypothetical protein
VTLRAYRQAVKAQRREREPLPGSREPEPHRPESASRSASLLTLQHAAGNRAVSMLLRDPQTQAAPQTDEQIWAADWDDPALASARGHFAGPDRPVGTPRQRYDVLCPLYKAQGIARPLKFVHDEIVDGTFFGHRTPLHVDLRTALQAAESALNNAGVTAAPFRSCWAFNPRTQSGGQWSNHADGKAIDIDADTNPRLLDPKKRAVISALTEHDMADQNLGYAGAAEASLRFQSRYSVVGLAERSEEISDDQYALEADRKEIADKLDILGKEKKPTAEQKNEAKALRQQLKAKQAELKANLAAQKAISTERDRLIALEKAVTDLDSQIDGLQAEIDALDATNDKAKLATLTARLRAKQRALTAATKARDEDPMRHMADVGFLDLDEQMVNALKAAGLRWGGDYKGAKDFMHFEVVH